MLFLAHTGGDDEHEAATQGRAPRPRFPVAVALPRSQVSTGTVIFKIKKVLFTGLGNFFFGYQGEGVERSEKD